MVIYIIDTYAWIEYFLGSKKGEHLKELFHDEKNEFYTVECCLAEIQGWALKNNQRFEELLKIIRMNSTLTELTPHDWIDAGKERFEQRKRQKDFGLIDATLLVKQKELGGKILSGDPHFKGMKQAVFLE